MLGLYQVCTCRLLLQQQQLHSRSRISWLGSWLAPKAFRAVHSDMILRVRVCVSR